MNSGSVYREAASCVDSMGPLTCSLRKVSLYTAVLAVILITFLSFAPHALAITYTYDANGQLTRADYDDGGYITYTYDAAGNITGKTVVSTSNLTVTRAGTGSGTARRKHPLRRLPAHQRSLPPERSPAQT